MAVAIYTEYKGKKGKDAIRSFVKDINDIPDRLAKNIPNSFYPTVANMVRVNFKNNYAAKEGWAKKTSSSNEYKKYKNWLNDIGASIRVGKIGVFPVIYDAATFGRLTGTISRNIGTKNATTVRTRAVHKKNMFIADITTGIDSSKWDGGNTLIYTNKDGEERHKDIKWKGSKKDFNQLKAFSAMVSPGGTSIFIRLTRSQMSEISDYIYKTIMKTASKIGVIKRNIP